MYKMIKAEDSALILRRCFLSPPPPRCSRKTIYYSMRKMFIIWLLKKIPQTKEQTNRARGAYSPSHNSRWMPPSVVAATHDPSPFLFVTGVNRQHSRLRLTKHAKSVDTDSKYARTPAIGKRTQGTSYECA